MAFYRFIELEHWVSTRCVKMQHNNKSHADDIDLFVAVDCGDKCMNTNRFISVWNFQLRNGQKSTAFGREKNCGFELSVIKYKYKSHKMPLNKKKMKKTTTMAMVFVLSRGKLPRNDLRKGIYGKWKRKMQTIFIYKRSTYRLPSRLSENVYLLQHFLSLAPFLWLL